jgi:ribose/xylose/arabinose/galactoside ABC-type transport system permease subunit
MKQFLDTALEAAAAASIPILARYHGSFEVEIKADATPVTIADREAEQAIRKVLGAAFPGHGIYGEEYGKDQPDAEYLWLVDPIDGTKGFGNAEGFEQLASLATGRVLGLPAPFLILIVVSVVMWFVLHRSVYGRYLLAVGRNEDAARFSGINTRFVIATAYVLMGLLAGVAGILLAFYTNSISPSNHGNFYELYGIAAAVLGGCSLRGGEGSVLGILIGTALLQVLENLVNLMGIPSSLNFAVMGAVVLVGVLADQIFQARAAKKLVRH